MNYWGSDSLLMALCMRDKAVSSTDLGHARLRRMKPSPPGQNIATSLKATLALFKKNA